jgi:hypothetical protein
MSPALRLDETIEGEGPMNVRCRVRAVRAAALLTLLAASGCAERPAVLASNAAGEKLRWAVAETPFATAEAEAGEHCAALGKRASLASVYRDQAMEIAGFACD